MTRHANVIWREFLLATTCFMAASQVGYAAATLPTGFSVGAGAGSVSTPNAATKTIHQTTDKAIFNWQSFSISSGAGVNFQQPGSGSIALNRVTGPGASQIGGSLTANGQVWLVNPNGVFFGAGSQVNVGGLLATTADIRNQDFLAGNYSFSGATSAAISNQGTLRAASGGSVVLAGSRVTNSGLIRADLGTVQLAAGKSFALDLTGDKLISFQVTAPVDQPAAPGAALISNTGTLGATGGQVLLTARAAKSVVDNVINTSGIVEAKSASLVNGQIVLDGGDAGTVQVAGRLDASGQAASNNVQVLGDKIKVAGATASSLKATGGSISLGSVTTTGVQSYNGPTTLVPGATLTSAANAILFNSSVTLGASGKAKTLAKIDTTNKGASPGGAGIRFAGTLGANAVGLNDLTLKAGTGGNVIFDQAVAGLGALTIASAKNVQINATDAPAPDFTAIPAVSVRSLAVTATGNVNSIGSISTNGQTDSHGGRQNAGNIVIAAGGDVSIGNLLGVGPGRPLIGVSARGGDATVKGAVAGNGGTLAITAASIELPAGFDTGGGTAALRNAISFTGVLSASDGGNGGAVTLHATGPVSIGIPANPQRATSGGGGAASTAGHSAGAGGAISISGARVNLDTFLDASGGNSDISTLSNGGNGGAIKISATAGDIATNDTSGIGGSIESQGGLGGGLTNMQHVGTGNASGGNGGAISLSATGAINLPNGLGASGGGFAAGLGQGGSAGPITFHAGSGAVSWRDLFANGGGSFLGNSASSAPVSITSGGAVTLGGEIDTRYFGTGAIGRHAGAVTVNALGNVAIGTGITGINLPAISTFNSGLGGDGAISLTGASILVPAGAVADLGGTHHATGGTIALTATAPTNGSVTSGPLTGTSVKVAAPGQVSLADVTANAGPIVLTGGNLVLNGPLSTLSGTILASATGPIQLTAPVTATGGDVLFTSLGGTGITVTNSAIRARNTPTDVSTNGTVSNTGTVALTGSTESAGTGRTVALHGP